MKASKCWKLGPCFRHSLNRKQQDKWPLPDADSPHARAPHSPDGEAPASSAHECETPAPLHCFIGGHVLGQDKWLSLKGEPGTGLAGALASTWSTSPSTPWTRGCVRVPPVGERTQVLPGLTLPGSALCPTSSASTLSCPVGCLVALSS